jgi:hypothetical protein
VVVLAWLLAQLSLISPGDCPHFQKVRGAIRSQDGFEATVLIGSLFAIAGIVDTIATPLAPVVVGGAMITVGHGAPMPIAEPRLPGSRPARHPVRILGLMTISSNYSVEKAELR